VDFCIAFGLLVGLMCWYHVVPGVTVLILPLVLAAISLMATGVGTGLAALNVKYRDFRYVIPFLVQFWMFGTPTIYMQPTGTTGKGYHALLALNPMTGLVASFRAACSGTPVPWGQLGLCSACALIVFVLGCFYFRRAEQHFADMI
jgi:lipopolysaccharide transport system permease protein